MEHDKSEIAVGDFESIEKVFKGEGLNNMNDDATVENDANDVRNAEEVGLLCENDPKVCTTSTPDTDESERSGLQVVKNSLLSQYSSPPSTSTLEVVNESYEEWPGSCEEALDDKDFSFEDYNETNNNCIEIADKEESEESDNENGISMSISRLSKAVRVNASNSWVEGENESLENFSFESINDALSSKLDEEKLSHNSREINNNAYVFGTEGKGKEILNIVPKLTNDETSSEVGQNRTDELQEEVQGQTVESTEELQIEAEVETLSSCTIEVKSTPKDLVHIQEMSTDSSRSLIMEANNGLTDSERKEVSLVYPVEKEDL